MKIPIPIFVYGYSAVVLCLTAIAVAISIYCGFRQIGNEISWRFIKFISTAVSVVGIVFLLMNFERMAGDQLISRGKEYTLNKFWNLKVDNIIIISKYCNILYPDQEEKGMCEVAHSTNNALSIAYLEADFPFFGISEEKNNLNIKKYANYVNESIKDINYSKPKKEDLYRIFNTDTRIKLTMLSIILLVIGITGSLGESVYQWRRSILLSRNKNTVSLFRFFIR